ncbi:MAG: dephospho-CoA kinase [Actinobacteria bacterium]|nr:dephospho-CoA kinase [Actinomycetota bacterium]MCB8995963.1 dephospho-CoA kinase [Actinomycetota bacterium]MCB9415264.1 dephospho-CoA kinase [Actinomycetota bacterium]MCB9424146.1 dephospho-CoA kinase [Actinomycetota bacterium]HRY10018.1 dephospho-CoA kinase [Candidatus Nanopelagicales bacterium]
MRRVGLTGGIGSGKSTVAQLFSELGAYVVDADRVAREVVAPGSDGLRALVAEFGPGICAPDGSLDRAAMAEVVFADESARARLNAITHPRIAARTAELMAALPDDAVVIHDVPLLAELGLQGAYDLVVVVDAPDDVRITRLIDRGLSESDARARIAAQAGREQRLAIADVVIDNSGDLVSLTQQVRTAWPRVAGRL